MVCLLAPAFFTLTATAQIKKLPKIKPVPQLNVIDSTNHVKLMRIDIWTDIVCPWCYIGKRQFENALAKFEHAKDVEIVFHSFELDPQAKTDAGMDSYDLLAKKYGVSRERSKEMHDQVAERAAGEGLTYNMDKLIPTNSFNAHRLIQLAGKHGKQAAVVENLSAAYLTNGRHIGSSETLLEVAAQTGLDSAEVKAMLQGDAYAQDVRADEEMAQKIGIRGVPFFVVNNKYGLSGAQGTATFLEVLQKTWDEMPAELKNADGKTCTPEGECK